MSHRNQLSATLTTLAASHAHLDQARRSARCLHVKSNGVPCGSPAMRRNPWCFFHDRFYNAPAEDTFPPLEDANAVQVALMHVLERLRREALRPGPLDLRAINSLLYGLQTAAFNAKRTTFDPAGLRSLLVTDDPLVSHREDREQEGTAAAHEDHDASAKPAPASVALGFGPGREAPPAVSSAASQVSSKTRRPLR